MYTMTVRENFKLNSVYISEMQSNFCYIMKSVLIMKTPLCCIYINTDESKCVC